MRVVAVDREQGVLGTARPRDRFAVGALALAARRIAPLSYRDYDRVRGALSPLLREVTLELRLADGSRFLYPAGDSYWAPVLTRSSVYERELLGLFESLVDIDYDFIDGGANYGWWSVLVSGPGLGSKRIVAVEASPATFARLGDNRAANGARFEAVNAALSDAAGERVALRAGHHAVQAIDETAPPAGGGVVTATLDGLAAEHGFGGRRPLLVKLDVEGAEVRALSGAQRILAADTLVVYEDHGSDRDHATTRFVLGLPGMAGWGWHKSRFVEIAKPEALDRIKVKRGAGYNLAATRSRFWQDVIARVLNPLPIGRD